MKRYVYITSIGTYIVYGRTQMESYYSLLEELKSDTDVAILGCYKVKKEVHLWKR